MHNPKHHRGLKRIRTPACEGKEPNQAEEDRQSSDSFGIDEALFGPSVGISIAVKIGADDACDNTCADEFGEAKCHRHKTGYDRHVEDSEVRDNGRRCGTTRKFGERVTTVVFGGRCRVRFLSLRTPGQI